jgi:tRNA modification GTPase
MVDGAARETRELIDTAGAGRMLRDGVNVVITGKPNVGKSSLLNALLRETRAIVSDTPGTTRDRVEEYANVRGIPVRFTDTAGIREAEGEIERIGVDMAADAVRDADIVLFVADGNSGIDENDAGVADIIRAAGEKTALLAVSKSDISQAINLAEAERLLPFAKTFPVSSVTMDGIPELEDGIADLVFGGRTASRERILVADARQKNLLLRAEAEATEAALALRAGEPLDFAEVNIRAAYDALGEITGETVTEDILDRVFEKFCIGK